jgi:hypothetical protein
LSESVVEPAGVPLLLLPQAVMDRTRAAAITSAMSFFMCVNLLFFSLGRAPKKQKKCAVLLEKHTIFQGKSQGKGSCFEGCDKFRPVGRPLFCDTTIM